MCQSRSAAMEDAVSDSPVLLFRSPSSKMNIPVAWQIREAFSGLSALLSTGKSSITLRLVRSEWTDE